MTAQEFYKFANELFAGVLVPAGFSNARSETCTFCRHASPEVYHFVMAWPDSRFATYEVRVFASSPVIDAIFWSRFPDQLGVPSDTWSKLSQAGIGFNQQSFNCKNEANMRRRYENTVGPLLTNVAVPYLDQFASVEEMIPQIRHPLQLGCALHHVGRIDEALPLLREQRDRISRLDKTDPEVDAWLRKLDAFLG